MNGRNEYNNSVDNYSSENDDNEMFITKVKKLALQSFYSKKGLYECFWVNFLVVEGFRYYIKSKCFCPSLLIGNILLNQNKAYATTPSGATSEKLKFTFLVWAEEVAFY